MTQGNLSARWRHRWYKVFPMEDLFGAIRVRLSPAERGIWYDLRSIASISAVPGLVSDDLGNASQHTYLANLLVVQIATLENTLKKVIEMGLCTEDKAGIHINNWQQLQSEYDRQKPYRKSEKRSQDPNKFVRGKYGGSVRR
jgi:hypothetical protein